MIVVITTKTHTHGGKRHEAGTRLSVNEHVAAWLISREVATHDQPLTTRPRGRKPMTKEI